MNRTIDPQRGEWPNPRREDEVIAELRPILNPRAVAIIGASNSPGRIGHTFAKAFRDAGFSPLYLVNPHDHHILGLPAYSCLNDVPGEVDLAYILTPTSTVLEIVAQCGAKGVKGIVVHTSGFAEHSAEGAILQAELVRVARQHGTRIIGPNCLGIFSPSRQLPSMIAGMPTERGPIALISHSGSFTEYIVKAAHSKGLYFDTAVSLGNEADINTMDLLAYFGRDPNISTIAAYLEGIHDGRRFMRLAREVAARKPVIVLKGGMTNAGEQAAGSHTGALAGSSRVWAAVFEQTGIIATNSLTDMLDMLFATVRLRPPAGPRVAIVSGPGGPAVLAADACVENGLRLAELSGSTRDRLASLLPAVGTSFRNPVDLGMATLNDPGIYRLAIEILAADENIDVLLAIGIADIRCALAMIDVNPTLPKPLLVAGLMPPEAVPGWYQQQARHGVAVYPDVRQAVTTLARFYRWSGSTARTNST